MILLVWSSEKAKDLAQAIKDRIGQNVCVVPTLTKACEHLRSNDCSAVLIDQWISEPEPARTDLVFECMGGAVVLFVNFGISSQERILRELRAALRRREREAIVARQQARVTLGDDLRNDVTSLLLSCGLALREPGLTEAVSLRLQHIKEVAGQVKDRLAIAENKTDKEENAARVG